MVSFFFENFHPKKLGEDSHLDEYFSDGLVQPPKSLFLRRGYVRLTSHYHLGGILRNMSFSHPGSFRGLGFSTVFLPPRSPLEPTRKNNHFLVDGNSYFQPFRKSKGLELIQLKSTHFFQWMFQVLGRNPGTK